MNFCWFYFFTQNIFVSYNMSYFDEDEDRIPNGEKTQMLEDDVIYSLWHLLSHLIDVWSVIFVVWSSGLSFVEDTGEDNCYVNAESGSESD